jgi:hypothetical protein
MCPSSVRIIRSYQIKGFHSIRRSKSEKAADKLKTNNG